MVEISHENAVKKHSNVIHGLQGVIYPNLLIDVWKQSTGCLLFDIHVTCLWQRLAGIIPILH